MKAEDFDANNLLKLTIEQYPDVPQAILSSIVQDFIQRPTFYKDIYEGVIEEPCPRDRADPCGNIL